MALHGSVKITVDVARANVHLYMEAAS